MLQACVRICCVCPGLPPLPFERLVWRERKISVQVITTRTDTPTVDSDRVPKHGVKKVANAFPIMAPPDCFCKDVGNIERLDLIAAFNMLFLRKRIRD